MPSKLELRKHLLFLVSFNEFQLHTMHDLLFAIVSMPIDSFWHTRIMQILYWMAQLAESRGIYRFHGRLVINAVLITLEMLQLC